MKKLIILLLIIPFFGISQKYQIIDREGEPVPFVTIYNAENQSGTISDNQGLFELASGQNVILSSIGFLKDTLTLPICDNICTIVLKEDIRQMEELVVYSDKKEWKNKFEEGFYDHKRVHYVDHLNNPSGYTFLLKIDNEKNVPAKLLKANFDVKNNGKTTMRVRIFAVDENGEPGHDILRENVMIEKFNIFTDISVDLAKYNIIMPPRGIFIGIDVYKIGEDDISFKLGIVVDEKAKSYRGNTFKDREFQLSERSVYGKPAYMMRNYRFSIEAAY
ncbi:hypothetical protein C9994_09770 [Marivirga lumbricoides]|uniref:Carboxypeptidase-like regulatory domain-containing protein n=1 Tax=Marivirga lumbricoides TaxID=1046115 RepID=A0A2T4DQ04_9BACT|nr:hypothetical protein C9994_09770 [Marivirga lumbricoides]